MDPEFLKRLRAEEAHPFEGWDFSHLRGRMLEDQPSWGYGDIVHEFLPHAASLLDMGTGGGEFLSSLQPLPPNTHATEGYAPNIPIARARLEPLGVHVHEIEGDVRLSLPDTSFDLVINRHESYAPGEVYRVLQPGGRFITQQVGGMNNIGLNELLDAPDPDDFGVPEWNLAFARIQLEDAGFTVVSAREEFPLTRFIDVGAIVYYLKAIPWQIPDFTVDRYLDRLKELEQRIRDDGCIWIHSHRFLLAATKQRR